MKNLKNNLVEKFDYYSPTRVVFGCGEFDKINSVLPENCKKILLITGSSALNNGLVDRFIKNVGHSNREIVVSSNITSDPDVTIVEDVVRLIKVNNIKHLVAIGGGSVIDAAKAASVAACCEDDLIELFNTNLDNYTSLWLCAVPTTAGTGAETSKGAILSWREKKFKGGIRGNALFPNVALVDPQLTTTLSKNQIALTGFDVFSHALESFISRKSSYETMKYSLSAIEDVTHYLPLILEDLSNEKYREILSYHSSKMGFNLANSSTCLPHRLQYPLGAMTNTAHAEGLIALYPTWVKESFDQSDLKWQRISECMQTGLGVKSIDMIFLLDQFLGKIDLKISLSSLGCDVDTCKKMAKMVEGNLANDPLWAHDYNIENFYLKAL